MNKRYPIDDFFRRQLGNHSVEPPMHVWDRIEESRRRTAVPALPPRMPIFLMAACTFLALLIPQSEWQPVQNQMPPAASQTAVVLPAVEALDDVAATDAPLVDTRSDNNVSSVASFTPAASNRISAPATLSVAIVLSEQTPTPFESPKDTEEDTNLYGAGSTDDSANSGAGFAYANWSAEQLPTRSNVRLLSRARSFPETSKCATFNNMGLRFHLEVTASPDLAFRQMEARSDDPEAQAYALMRETSEQPYYNYSFSARLAASTRFGLTLRSGVNYSQINERIRYVTETEERFTIINIIGPGGNITGVDTVYETIHREHTIQNSYRTLDIPLLAGYEIPVKRWLLSAHGGAFINMLFRQQGSMYLPGGNTPVRFATAAQEGSPIFRNRLGVGWYAGAGVAYKIRHNLQIMAEPHIRAYPKSFTTEQFAVRQSYWQGGLALGLRYQI